MLEVKIKLFMILMYNTSKIKDVIYSKIFLIYINNHTVINL